MQKFLLKCKYKYFIIVKCKLLKEKDALTARKGKNMEYRIGVIRGDGIGPEEIVSGGKGR